MGLRTDVCEICYQPSQAAHLSAYLLATVAVVTKTLALGSPHAVKRVQTILPDWVICMRKHYGWEATLSGMLECSGVRLFSAVFVSHDHFRHRVCN